MDVKHVAKLANLPLTSTEEKKFASQFADTLKTIDLINKLDTSQVSPTYQVTGLTNITRDDEVDTSRLIPQSQVLAQAKHTHQGYLVVPPVFDE
jgi:aspartyl-tRNA(Asn)/glutamyl-tRNA(Gln) amidotransferase subunit C